MHLKQVTTGYKPSIVLAIEVTAHGPHNSKVHLQCSPNPSSKAVSIATAGATVAATTNVFSLLHAQKVVASIHNEFLRSTEMFVTPPLPSQRQYGELGNRTAAQIYWVELKCKPDNAPWELMTI